ncbi:hypothetical protein GCM10011410_03720 [Hoyosella rhizosphaerae]|uniref:Bacterial Pleckstrin homology domain-containing protein n=2 Tax=Hoyosella rhizosphaerae TaxID=1755582 RepID=A0A916TZW3_9ACTN|nr:hypothetical protein GCM10011410_03720 [Hoyosella rhizosphaerae]
MAEQLLYDDGLVQLSDTGVTLRRYYFPTGAAKYIPYTRIVRVGSRRMGWLTGKARGWGSGGTNVWMPFDPDRRRKSTLVILDVDDLIKPAFSPADPQRVLALLREKITTH